MSDAKHIEAILTIAEREIESSEYRAGVLNALVEQSLPYLRRQLAAEKTLEVVRRELADAESNASERSDPASNQEADDLIRTLRSLIAKLEVPS